MSTLSPQLSEFMEREIRSSPDDADLGYRSLVLASFDNGEQAYIGQLRESNDQAVRSRLGGAPPRVPWLFPGRACRGRSPFAGRRRGLPAHRVGQGRARSVPDPQAARVRCSETDGYQEEGTDARGAAVCRTGGLRGRKTRPGSSACAGSSGTLRRPRQPGTYPVESPTNSTRCSQPSTRPSTDWTVSSLD